jgi:hypothetical protein
MNYHHRTNLAQDENDDVLADYHSILNRWKICFFQLTKIHTSEPSPFEVHIGVGKLKGYKLPGIDYIVEGLIQAGDKIYVQDPQTY